MYSRVKYAIRTTRISGCRAVIVGRPGPLNDVAGPDGYGAGIEVGPALSDGHVRRRRAREDWKEDDEKDEQSDMHFGLVISNAIWSRGQAQRTPPSTGPYGRNVPDLARTTVVSPLLMKPSAFTSERKFVASVV
jgi:hypothetical protein